MMYKRIKLFLLIFLFCTPFCLSADWTMFMGNHYLTGNNDEIVPTDNTLNWTFPAPSFLYYPVSHKKIVFVNCLDKYIYALNEITGEIIWKCKLERPSFKSPVTWKNYVLVNAGDYIYCIDINTGRINWSRKEGISIQLSTPIVIHNIVFYGSRKYFFARDVRNGREIWRNDKVKIFGGTPVYWNKRIYFISKEYSMDLSQLFCLSATNGQLLWKQDIPGDPNIFTPVVYNKKVFFGSLNKLYSFNALNGDPVWIKQYKHNVAYHTVFANNHLYMSLDNGRIYMLNPENGNITSSFTNFNDKGANFIIIGETLFIPNQKGQLYSFQSYSKKINWKFQTDFTNHRSTLSSANGRIYLATANRLYSISTGTLPPGYPIIASVKKEKIDVKLKDNNNRPLRGEIIVYQNKKTTRYKVKKGKITIEVEKDKEFTIIARAEDYFVKTISRDPNRKRKDIEITLEPIRTHATYVFNDISFKYDSAELTESSFPTLTAIAELFKENPDLKIEIWGHTDSRGDEDYNLRLSHRRANKVKEFMVKNGIPDTRINSTGYGESKPIASNDTDEGRIKNRRVEFNIK